MPWKKDLAKLKQDLGKEDEPPAKATPPPKAKTPHPVSSSIEEEDNIFLSAMGLRPRTGGREAAAPPRDAPPAQALPPAGKAAPAPSAKAVANPVADPQPSPAAGPISSKAEFSSAMGDLKGLKPLKPAVVQDQPPPARGVPAPPPPEPPSPAPQAPAEPPAPEPPPAPQASAPSAPAPAQVQIQLAAGMAIVVDGSLDLKGHARSDAEERLKERLLDGYALGWRTLHVVVGPSAELRQMVLDLLQSSAGRCVSRFAQAPVPMGGASAWILYFRGPGASEN